MDSTPSSRPPSEGLDELVAGYYGGEFSLAAERPASPRFSLATGQMRGQRNLGHNVSWFNAKGEKLGWGDLDADDVVRIAQGLQPGEVFLTCSEAIFWRHVTDVPGPTGAHARTTPDESRPGRDALLKDAMFLMAPGEVHSWRRAPGPPEGRALASGAGTVRQVVHDRAGFERLFDGLMDFPPSRSYDVPLTAGPARAARGDGAPDWSRD